MTATVRKAQESDISAIVALASKLAYTVDETDPPQSGFLVAGFTEADYSRFLSTAEHFYVCVDNDSIRGFMLAYGSQSIDPVNRVDSILKYVYVDDFAVVKQIAVDPEHQRTGVGTRLYRFLIERTPNIAILAAVVLAPSNPVSVRFHERF